MRVLPRALLALLLVAGGWPAAAGEVVFEDGFESGGVDAWSAAPGWVCQDEGYLMALQNLVLASLPHTLAPDVVTVTAGAEGSSNLAANLKTLVPSEFARLTSVLPHQSWWEVDFGSTAIQNVRALALGGHTLVPGDQVRGVAVSSGALPDVVTEYLAPTAVEEEDSMLDSAVTRIDDAVGSPDGLKATFFTVGSFIRVSFPTPASPPALGSNCQFFLVWVNLSTAPANPEDYPSLTAELWEGGVKRADLGTKTPSSTAGQLLLFPWSASDLASSDGSGVELKLIQNQPAGLRVILMDYLSWGVLSATDLAAADTDTGWHTITGAEVSSRWGGTATQAVDLPPPLWHVFLDTPATIAKARVEIRGDGVGYFDSFLQTPPRTPATAIDAGYLIVSHAWEAEYNFAPGGRLRAVPRFVGGETSLTGSNNQVVQYRRREFEADLTLREDEAAELFERLDYAGAGQAFLVSTQPGATGTVARNSTFLATVAESSGHGYEKPMRGTTLQSTRSARYRFVERL